MTEQQPSMEQNTKLRTAGDSLGQVQLPADAYYGAQTQRAVLNFPISGYRLPREFIKAQGIIKASAAAVHKELGELDGEIADAILAAADEVIEGRWDSQFVVDAFQAGAGTSQNMNANEVIANVALEKLGLERDRKDKIHPNDHVNKGQSTNDTIPTAICISVHESVERKLLPALDKLIGELANKSREFHLVVKSGRTHLQDAVPLRLGQEFEGYAATIGQMRKQLEQAADGLLELGIGGNAVGTGVNTHPEYAARMVAEIGRRTGTPYRQAPSRFAFMQNPSAALRVSGLLRDLAVHLIKLSSDIRLLNSGPQTGLAEIRLPAVQPGSSIMPGKVNPVLPEMLYMVCCQVIGNDTAVQTAMIGSQLEINVMMPVIAHNVLQSAHILSTAAEAFCERCVKGIEADEEQCRYWMDRSLSLVTMLNPVIGYDKAAEIAKESLKTQKPLRQLVVEKGILTEDEWERIVQNSLSE
ncbi:aspartate ammonia-lyase [Paenibacillus chitinolyticus]|uniref:aspartate ammonia-lyase n=1 Tax=Paenibacillus chitinolyticus TaxID=79263 RepID=A0A410WWA8_9BACL|nr:aspartate ammonia-lyase [Paenibacillus chitinolyticus]MCY9592765.1 aspartate ammonia-lyase [Paenibacillus chitinolyticus]MCY9597633.1 aspartate ammonia-lyase [Paenibacillus chitinolyticus]QAV18620.1 aspartate ammonia-lyase [Paenibacillus chitinolyticus]